MLTSINSECLIYENNNDLMIKLMPAYIFSVLQYCIKCALLAENKRRLTHMEDATHHLDKKSQQLAIKANQWRQEKIVEEIEALLVSQYDAEV